MMSRASQENAGLAQDFLDYLLCDAFFFFLDYAFVPKGLEDYLVKHFFDSFIGVCSESRVAPPDVPTIKG